MGDWSNYRRPAGVSREVGIPVLGDSGSPVFTWKGWDSEVELHGITWGSNSTSTALSQWLYIDLELNFEIGALDVTY